MATISPVNIESRDKMSFFSTQSKTARMNIDFEFIKVRQSSDADNRTFFAIFTNRINDENINKPPFHPFDPFLVSVDEDTDTTPSRIYGSHKESDAKKFRSNEKTTFYRVSNKRREPFNSLYYPYDPPPHLYETGKNEELAIYANQVGILVGIQKRIDNLVFWTPKMVLLWHPDETVRISRPSFKNEEPTIYMQRNGPSDECKYTDIEPARADKGAVAKIPLSSMWFAMQCDTSESRVFSKHQEPDKTGVPLPLRKNKSFELAKRLKLLDK